MKNPAKFALLAMLIPCVAACNKDEDKDDDNRPSTGTELIAGTWEATNEEWYSFDAETNDTLDGGIRNIPAGTMLYTFSEDGVFEGVEEEDSISGTYALKGVSLSIFSEEDTTSFDLIALDESHLIIGFLEAADSNTVYQEHTHFAKK